MLALAACGGSTSSTGASGGGAGAAGSPVTLHLGYFPNITHATALVAVDQKLFEKNLPAGTTLQTATFNAGPDAVNALFSEALDISYIGPNPAVNSYVKSNGQATRIIAGSTSGGAALVVKPAINGPADLKGKKIADPQLGGTQDVSLRNYLKKNGLTADVQGGGEVSVAPQDNAQTLDTFKSGAIDGAWVPEPWASRLVIEAGAKVLVDERDLWPGKQFPTTVIVVRTAFLTAHPDVVTGFLKGHVEANDFIAAHPADAQKIANAAIAKITGKSLKDEVVAQSFAHMSFTTDPLAAAVMTQAAQAVDLGLVKQADLSGIFDLGPLNTALTALGKPEVRT